MKTVDPAEPSDESTPDSGKPPGADSSRRTQAVKTSETRQIVVPTPREPQTPMLTPAPSPPPEPGGHIGPYLIQSPLGQGVSCHVFRGWDETHSCPVAIKVVNWANVYDRPAAMRQLRTEAAALARVKHPSVVRFIDFGFDPRWPYLVTEFFDGRPLGELLRDGGALPPVWGLYLISQMVDALGAVWRAGLVHRDIKSDNILVGPNGNGKLIDFGLAKAECLQTTADRSSVELAGTAPYIAPEQARNANICDHRSDVYSLGVTLFESLTGRLPIEGKNRIQVIYQHINTPPTPPRQLVPEIPPLASDLCLWMLAKSPDDRPQNHSELRQAFDTVMGSMQ